MDRILNSGNTSRQLSIQIFSWLLYMKSPLTPSALLAAITTVNQSSVALVPTDISELCANLVTVDTRGDIVRFAHHSIQEYLLRTKQALFSSTVAHSLLASTCIEVNSRGPPNQGTLASQVKDFYFYAATYWASHFEVATIVEQNEDLFRQLVSFVFEEEDIDVSLSFEFWTNACTEIVNLLPDFSPIKPALDAMRPKLKSLPSPLFLAAVFGIEGLMSLLASPERETNWNQRNERGHTAIYLAANSGHASSVVTLIENGAEINVECGKQGSPLHAACFKGHAKIVEQLLQNGACVACGTTFENALDAAFHGRHEDIVLLLIRHGSSIQSDLDYEQAVQMAVEYGFSDVLDELQKPTFGSFRQETKPDKQKMRMAKAIKGGQLHILERHLRNVSNSSELLPRDAVAIAAFYGHSELVRFLLDKGMSIEAEGQFGTPLRSASLMNKRSVVRQLLEHRANVKTGESNGNPLYVAAVKGHTDIAKLLLHEGADVHQNTGSFGTSLQAAA